MNLGPKQHDAGLGQGSVLVGAGVIAGLLAAATATRIVESVLFGVTPADPLTFIAVTALLLAVGWSPVGSRRVGPRAKHAIGSQPVL